MKTVKNIVININAKANVKFDFWYNAYDKNLQEHQV